MASVMCSYGVLNGVNDCADPSLYRLLRSWGFTGFVRSDLGAVDSPAAAFRAGLDLVKPSRPAWTKVMLTRGVREHVITQKVLNAATARAHRDVRLRLDCAATDPRPRQHRLPVRQTA